MLAVPSATGTYTGLFNPNNMGADRTVLINCDDANLQLYNSNQNIYNSRFNLVMPSYQSSRPCSINGVTGYTYQTYSQNGPQNVINLCYSNQRGTLRSWNTQSPFIRIGSNWRYNNWNGVTFDQFQYYTSFVVLHEFMHCITFNGGISGVNRITSTLPLNTGPEVYSWAEISALADSVKPYNANGHAMVGVALWLCWNKISVRTGVGAMSGQYPFDQRPEPGPHFQ